MKVISTKQMKNLKSLNKKISKTLGMIVLCFALSSCSGRLKKYGFQNDSTSPTYNIHDQKVGADGTYYVEYVIQKYDEITKTDRVLNDVDVAKEDLYSAERIINAYNIYEDRTLPMAIIFKDKLDKDNRLIVIRGTSNKYEFKSDAHDKLVPFVTLKARRPRGASVHAGFYQIYDSLRSQIVDSLVLNNVKKVSIVCHSLGCGIAAMLLYDILDSVIYKQQIKEVHSYFYASPRVGNKNFINELHKKIEDNSNSVAKTFVVFQNIKDIVPHLPLKISGYEDYKLQSKYLLCYHSKNTLSIKGNIVFNHRYYSDALNKIFGNKNPRINVKNIALCDDYSKAMEKEIKIN